MLEYSLHSVRVDLLSKTNNSNSLESASAVSSHNKNNHVFQIDSSISSAAPRSSIVAMFDNQRITNSAHHNNNNDSQFVIPIHETICPNKLPKPTNNNNGVDNQQNKETIFLNKRTERANRANLVLHKKPLQTIYYFFREIPFVLFNSYYKIIQYKKMVTIALVLSFIAFLFDTLDGPHTQTWLLLRKSVLWWAWWVMLGFMSSCGFGTGLHTFVLYLGPFIAKVTLAAYECHSTQFPSPPFPEEIVCPNQSNSQQQQEEITLWAIVKKVQIEAVLWGIGTAIGELPPYFVARAARLSNQHVDDEELEEFEELLKNKKKQVKSSRGIDNQNNNPSPSQRLSWTKRFELFVTDLILKSGFFGIVLCASIPNPFFDLAGLTCGHFNVPFWTFFGATLIGKAFIKMHIQQLFVIAIFSEHHVETILSFIKKIPHFGEKLCESFLEYLAAQKEKLHKAIVTQSTSWLQWLIGLLTWFLIGFFLYSIVNSLAQNYDRRLCQWRRYAAETSEKMK